MSMRTDKQRRLLKAGAVVLCVGFLYGYILIPLGLRIPCPFRAITGLRCPGCGVTDMCLAVRHGCFLEVPNYNWGLALAIPGLTWLVWSHAWRADGPAKAEKGVSICLLAFLAGWMVYRNIYGV